ncbi:b149 [miniopterid betaherpesvirus 1]|uniref:B149 n=1 Tax=miniopterid betaherpesvirus 1 TaxID=3070189 RepID=I3VQD5_9BETA|nr:b149 [miniopterid betaherpesvirus 1]AFK83979.1 b149 [miniopterid betaherpesvirus 1]
MIYLIRLQCVFICLLYIQQGYGQYTCDSPNAVISSYWRALDMDVFECASFIRPCTRKMKMIVNGKDVTKSCELLYSWSIRYTHHHIRTATCLLYLEDKGKWVNGSVFTLHDQDFVFSNASQYRCTRSGVNSTFKLGSFAWESEHLNVGYGPEKNETGLRDCGFCVRRSNKNVYISDAFKINDQMVHCLAATTNNVNIVRSSYCVEILIYFLLTYFIFVM